MVTDLESPQVATMSNLSRADDSPQKRTVVGKFKLDRFTITIGADSNFSGAQDGA